MKRLSTDRFPQYQKVLLQSALFADCPSDELPLFLEKAPTLLYAFPKDAYIALAGEAMSGMGLLLEGEALLGKENALGQRTIVAKLHPGALFGEALLFTKYPLWPATIQATDKAVVLFITFASLAQPISGCEALQSQLHVNLLRDLSQKALLLNQKVRYLTLKGMRDRILAYFHDIAVQQGQMTIHLPHTRQEMADVLNVSRPSMCRELSRMVKDGLITLEKRTVTLRFSL